MPVIPTNSRIVRALTGLHLYHYGISSCSQRVRMVLEEKGLPWTSHLVDLRQEAQFDPQYVAINPNAVVPTLVRDGVVVVESIDIMRYLEVHFPRPVLGPADHAHERDFTQLLAAADEAQSSVKTLSHEFLFRGAGRPLTQQEVEARAVRRMNPESAEFVRLSAARNERWMALVYRHLRAMADATGRLEHRLLADPWLSGRQFGLVDIAWLSTIHRIAMMGWPLDRTPALERWYAQLRCRPSFAKAILEYEPADYAQVAGRYVAERSAQGHGLGQLLAASVGH